MLYSRCYIFIGIRYNREINHAVLGFVDVLDPTVVGVQIIYSLQAPWFFSLQNLPLTARSYQVLWCTQGCSPQGVNIVFPNCCPAIGKILFPLLRSAHYNLVHRLQFSNLYFIFLKFYIKTLGKKCSCFSNTNLRG